MKKKYLKFLVCFLSVFALLLSFKEAKAGLISNISQSISQNISQNGGLGTGGVQNSITNFVSYVDYNGGVGNGGVSSTVSNAVEQKINESISKTNSKITDYNKANGTVIPELSSAQITTTAGEGVGNRGNNVTISNEKGTSVSVTQGGLGLPGKNHKSGDEVEIHLSSGYVVGARMQSPKVSSLEYQRKMLMAGVVYAGATANDKDKIAKVAFASTNLIVAKETSGKIKFSTLTYNTDGSMNYGSVGNQPFYVIPPEGEELGRMRQGDVIKNVLENDCSCAGDTCKGDSCVGTNGILCLGKKLPGDCAEANVHCLGTQYSDGCGGVCVGTADPGDCSDAGLYCKGLHYLNDCGEKTCVGTKEPNCCDAFLYCYGQEYPSYNGCGVCVGTMTSACEGSEKVCKGEEFGMGNCNNGKKCVGTKEPCSDSGDFCSGQTYIDSCRNSCVGTKSCSGECGTPAGNSSEACDLKAGTCDYGTVQNFQVKTDGWEWECVGNGGTEKCSVTKKCENNWTE